MKKNKGFTLVEIMVVVAMMAIFLMLSLTSFGPAREYSAKSEVNTYNKILVNAIDSWVADNSNATQRPANFESQNSQGHSVYEYIAGEDIYRVSNLKKNGDDFEQKSRTDSNANLYITFDKGVLNVAYFESKNESDPLYEKRFLVYGNEDDSKTAIDDYDQKVNTHLIIVNKYEPIIYS